jgi:hypothetical protein
MYSPNEEDEILQGIDEIIYNLQKVPLDQVAFFLVKENMELAVELNRAIDFQLTLRNIKYDTNTRL